MSYRDDVARYQRHANERARRQWQNANETYQDLQTQYHETLAAADEAQDAGDKEALNYAYDELTRIEGEIAPYEEIYRQQQQATPHPAAAQWDWQHKGYRDALERKLGPQGAQRVYAAADAYATRPRAGENDPDRNNPDRTGMGLQRNSPQYFQAMNNLLEQYSNDVTGVPFDAKDTIPTWKEAARISGLSEEEYAANYNKAKAMGKIGTGS